jgi:hypothetical protein
VKLDNNLKEDDEKKHNIEILFGYHLEKIVEKCYYNVPSEMQNKKAKK